MNKTCSTCKHFSPDKHDEGWGNCGAPMFGKYTATEVIWIIRNEVFDVNNFPHSLSVSLESRKMHEEDGAGCPVWTGKK